MQLLRTLQTVATGFLGVGIVSGLFIIGFGEATVVPLQLLLICNSTIVPLLGLLAFAFIGRALMDDKFQIFAEVSDSFSFVFLMVILVLAGVMAAEWFNPGTTTFEMVLQRTPTEFALVLTVTFVVLALIIMAVLAIVQWVGEMLRLNNR
jgi:hypothetical protein